MRLAHLRVACYAVGMAEHTITLDAVANARADYGSWKGVTPVDAAERKARLLADPVMRAYWATYATEVARLQAVPV